MGILLNIKELHHQDVSVLIFKIMELKEFIKIALIEISAALKETSDDADERGLIINPEVSHHKNDRILTQNGINYSIYDIDFDIAITSEDRQASTKQGGGNIKVISAKVDSMDSKNNSNISRIKFSVPVVYPRPHDISKIKADSSVKNRGMI